MIQTTMLRLLLQGKATPHARNRRAHRQLSNGRRISSAASTFDYPFGSSMILLTPAAVSCPRREDRVCFFYRQTRAIGFSGQVRRLGFSVAPCHFVAGAATRCAIGSTSSVQAEQGALANMWAQGLRLLSVTLDIRQPRALATLSGRKFIARCYLYVA